MTSPDASPRPWTTIPHEPHDIALVACDMDGSLLDPDSQLPHDFASGLHLLRERGITFVPASGRQLATLQAMFAEYETDGPLTYIAENGTIVQHGGEIVSTTLLDADAVADGIEVGRRVAQEMDAGVVVCGVNSAYIERHDDPFVDEVDIYYKRLEKVGSLDEVDDDVLKLAFFTFGDASVIADEYLAHLAADHQVVTSGAHWVDMMSKQADKGRALRALQEAIGVSREQTAAFGDYLNDAELLRAAQWSFAMENAHPDVLALAAYVAPSNADNGVPRALSRLLGL